MYILALPPSDGWLDECANSEEERPSKMTSELLHNKTSSDWQTLVTFEDSLIKVSLRTALETFSKSLALLRKNTLKILIISHVSTKMVAVELKPHADLQ
jgi:hypothetical protein